MEIEGSSSNWFEKLIKLIHFKLLLLYFKNDFVLIHIPCLFVDDVDDGGVTLEKVDLKNFNFSCNQFDFSHPNFQSE